MQQAQRPSPRMSHRLLPETILRGHAGEAQSLNFAHDDKLLLCGDSTGSVRVWDLQTARTATAVHAHSEDAGVLQVRSRGADVITQGRDGEICLWDLASDSSLQRIRSICKEEWYNFCKCCLPRCSTSNELHRHSLAAAGMGNKGVQILDWREGGPVLHCHSEEDHGMTMCLDIPDLAQPTVLAGCDKTECAFSVTFLVEWLQSDTTVPT